MPLLLPLLACLAAHWAVGLGNAAVVTCGSTLKLQHVATKFRLHSHEVAYSRGSQQQSVTTYPTGDDGNSLWVVQSFPPCAPGAAFTKGQTVRLQHTATRKWLHSHLFKSPLTAKQEVSAYGSDSQSDGGDVWVLEWDGKDKVWEQDTKVRLKHRDTGAYLYSHVAKFGQPISGQQEACAWKEKDKNTEWQAAEGVYIPAAEGGEDGQAGSGAGSTSTGSEEEL